MFHKCFIAKLFFILLTIMSDVCSQNTDKALTPKKNETIHFPLQKEWLEKRYQKRDPNNKVKLFFIVHNIGFDSFSTKKILKLLPKEVSISITPYIKQHQNTLKSMKQKGHNVLWVQPMELYRQPNNILDPYRLSRHKDQKQNKESVTSSLSNMPDFITAVIADETSPVLRDEETLSTLLLELKSRNLPLLSPEMSVNSEFIDLCYKHNVDCNEADYAISRTDTPADAISLLAHIKELGEQTGYAVCIIDAYTPHIERFLEWYNKLDKNQFELSPIQQLLNTFNTETAA